MLSAARISAGTPLISRISFCKLTRVDVFEDLRVVAQATGQYQFRAAVVPAQQPLPRAHELQQVLVGSCLGSEQCKACVGEIEAGQIGLVAAALADVRIDCLYRPLAAFLRRRPFDVMPHVDQPMPDYRYAAGVHAETTDQMGIAHVIAVADQVRVCLQDLLRFQEDRFGRPGQIAQGKIDEDDIGNGNDFGSGYSGKFGPEDCRAIPDVGDVAAVYLAHEAQQLLLPDRLIDANRELVAAQFPQRDRSRRP